MLNTKIDKKQSFVAPRNLESNNSLDQDEKDTISDYVSPRPGRDPKRMI